MGQEGCHTAQPQPPSTKPDKPTLCALCSCFPFSNIFSFLQTLGSCPFHVCQHTAKDFSSKSECAVCILLLLCNISSGRLRCDCSYIMYSSTSLLQAPLRVDSPSTTRQGFHLNIFLQQGSLYSTVGTFALKYMILRKSHKGRSHYTCRRSKSHTYSQIHCLQSVTLSETAHRYYQISQDSQTLFLCVTINSSAKTLQSRQAEFFSVMLIASKSDSMILCY